ncbi:TetR/AcrR family transcriptional regulator [Candidatus Halobonum tyrrellensis]|uniref:TetR family transcriptional regulator n=1 Tax=Candidatus Halobonum tyrrellensis G22 TaxID=1324957 RepID=V4GPE8_9EURY|nr:TetR/AcrR family transcriptional regulator [Candidatus Halobonum tyrrellensis]ESP87256.1 TetR family transcriptional regulator [Candidatus Halobonum tyrrellensis G22]
MTDQPDDNHDTEAAFIDATYCALCARGYADLTMQDIADETDKSKAALHYHFDGKQDLLLRFLDHLNEDFLDRTADPTGETPADRLVDLLRTILDADGDDDNQFTTAFMEIKAQAPYRDGYRERLREVDDRLREQIGRLVAEGVDAGQFDADADPEVVADHVVTYVHGTWTRSAAVGADVDAMRERLVAYVDSLFAADADVSVAPGSAEEEANGGSEERETDAEGGDGSGRADDGEDEEVAA